MNANQCNDPKCHDNRTVYVLHSLLRVSGKLKGSGVNVNMICGLVETPAADLIPRAKGARILASINH